MILQIIYVIILDFRRYTGHELIFAHSHAIVESKKIGADTRIWAFAHILPDVEIEGIAI